MRKITLIVLAFILAIIGLIKRETVPLYLTIVIVFLLILYAVIQIIIEQKQYKEEAKSKYFGVLKPKSKILLSAEKNTFPKFEFGDSGAILVKAGKPDEPLFKIFRDNYLTIKIKRGKMKVSTIIRDRNGAIIAELENNEWKVNQNNSFDRNYSKNALEVKDSSGDIVLQVKLIEDRVQFQGKFYDSRGNGVAFGKVRGSDGKIGGCIEITGTARPNLTLHIEPIFEYPSELHLGELRNEH